MADVIECQRASVQASVGELAGKRRVDAVGLDLMVAGGGGGGGGRGLGRVARWIEWGGIMRCDCIKRSICDQKLNVVIILEVFVIKSLMWL
jgi:hypothetical protein